MTKKIFICACALVFASYACYSQTDPNTKVKTKSRDGQVKTKIEDANGQKKVEVERDGKTVITTNNPGEGKIKTIYPAPDWAPAHSYNNDRPVYFPDYYMFYVPGRGYTYWMNNAWQTADLYPDVYSTVDWPKARVHVLTDLDLAAQPEREFVRYRDMFPAQRVETEVLAPDVK